MSARSGVVHGGAGAEALPPQAAADGRAGRCAAPRPAAPACPARPSAGRARRRARAGSGAPRPSAPTCAGQHARAHPPSTHPTPPHRTPNTPPRPLAGGRAGRQPDGRRPRDPVRRRLEPRHRHAGAQRGPPAHRGGAGRGRGSGVRRCRRPWVAGVAAGLAGGGRGHGASWLAGPGRLHILGRGAPWGAGVAAGPGCPAACLQRAAQTPALAAAPLPAAPPSRRASARGASASRGPSRSTAWWVFGGVDCTVVGAGGQWGACAEASKR
jgi:translation initiation factor IF-2